VTPSVSGLLASGIAASYVPSLRGQIRDGEVRLPVGGVTTLRLRRDEHPLAFRLCAAAMVMLTVGLIVVGVGMIAKSFR